jgi:hypothetical protein
MKAKTIVENKFWILEEDDGKKIGTISARNNVVTAIINDKQQSFKNLEELSLRYNVSFNKKTRAVKSTPDMEVYDFPTAHSPFNALWHVEKKLPIYTKTTKSNSYHCAGYYIIRFEHGWVKSFSPKLITLQRYEYKGPFKTKFEMSEQLRLHNEHI